jgi:sugar phosphate isomerase/epimerase
MQTISRRQFLGTTALGAVAVSYLPFSSCDSAKTPFGWPLSFQSWGVRDQIVNDFDGTLRKLQAVGFKGVEMCSPKGYEWAGFAPLVKVEVSEMRKRIEDAGLFCKTCHMQHHEVVGDELSGTIEWGEKLGLHDLVIAAAALGEDATLDDWKRVAEEFNKSGEIIRNAGLQLVYHNHTIGPEIDGEQLYDILMRLLNPDVVRMQFQVACISEGFDVVEYIAKYPGRYISLHMHDWDPEQKKIVPLGKGVVDWNKLLTTAKAGGIADYGMILELESQPPDDPFQALVDSYAWLTGQGI